MDEDLIRATEALIQRLLARGANGDKMRAAVQASKLRDYRNGRTDGRQLVDSIRNQDRIFARTPIRYTGATRWADTQIE